MSRDWAKLCLKVKLPYCQHRNIRQLVSCLTGEHALLAGALWRSSVYFIYNLRNRNDDDNHHHHRPPEIVIHCYHYHKNLSKTAYQIILCVGRSGGNSYRLKSQGGALILLTRQTDRQIGSSVQSTPKHSPIDDLAVILIP